MACSITLPYLTGRVIDDVLNGGDRSALVPLVWTVVGIVLLRAVFNIVRRLVSGQISLGVEFDLRGILFAHLQRMSLSYFDRMPVGQLMSRATSDLQTVRFFLGYGLIFIFMQAFTLIIVTGLMLWLNWSLALLALLVGPALLVVAWRYSRRSNPILIDVQQRVGEVVGDGRGERGRHPGDQGLRPRGRPHRAVRAHRDAGLRPQHGRRPPGGLVPAADGLPAHARAVRRAGLRGHPDDRRRHEPGRVRHLLPLPQHAHGALPLAGGAGGAGPARGGRRDAPLRGARLGPGGA